MDLKQYQQAKFELADILRISALAARALDPANRTPFEDLFARLAEDQFNIAVVGRFNRGKTSLMNAMLDTERLPTGIVPLTSVITTVQYGTEERAVIEYQERRIPSTIALEALPDYITQKSNPGNTKGIRFARVELPSEILRRGFYLVDTPGLGSAFAENTRTTEAYLPEADAFIVVTSYDSPLSDDELRLIADLGATGRRMFVVMNKQDLVTAAEQAEVKAHLESRIAGLEPESPIELFSVSARDAVAANRLADQTRLAATGVPRLMERLTRFLVEEKQSEFLLRMCGRIRERLEAIPGCAEGVEHLAVLERKIAASGGDAGIRVKGRAVPKFGRCQVCAPVAREVLTFLQEFQYRITNEHAIRETLARDGGLCAFHTWQYAALASPHGTCIGFPDVLSTFAARLEGVGGNDTLARANAVREHLSANRSCALCAISSAAESKAIAAIALLVAKAQASQDYPDICLRHLPGVVEALASADLARDLVAAERDSLERVAEDMRRYALKRDGTRRAFTTSDELDAHLRGLVALAGHAYLSFPRQTD